MTSSSIEIGFIISSLSLVIISSFLVFILQRYYDSIMFVNKNLVIYLYNFMIIVIYIIILIEVTKYFIDETSKSETSTLESSHDWILHFWLISQTLGNCVQGAPLLVSLDI